MQIISNSVNVQVLLGLIQLVDGSRNKAVFVAFCPASWLKVFQMREAESHCVNDESLNFKYCQLSTVSAHYTGMLVKAVAGQSDHQTIEQFQFLWLNDVCPNPGAKEKDKKRPLQFSLCEGMPVFRNNVGVPFYTELHSFLQP